MLCLSTPAYAAEIDSESVSKESVAQTFTFTKENEGETNKVEKIERRTVEEKEIEEKKQDELESISERFAELQKGVDATTQTNVSLNDGKNYGPGGEGHLRIVLGVFGDNKKVEDALLRIKAALLKYQGL